jgi:hypothetical protein
MRDSCGGFSDVRSPGFGLFGFWLGIEPCIARLGFELVVPLPGIQMSVFRSARDSVAGYSQWIFGCDFAWLTLGICLCHRFPFPRVRPSGRMMNP